MTADPTVLDRVAADMAEAELPFHVLHQTVIVMLGLYGRPEGPALLVGLPVTVQRHETDGDNDMI